MLIFLSEQIAEFLTTTGKGRQNVPIKIGTSIIVRYAIGSRGSPDYYSRRKITVPPKETIPIEQMLKNYEAALAQTGYSITTKLLLVKRAELMIRRYLNAGLAYFDQTLINRYMGEIDDKYFKGNMQKKHYERTKREIDRFVSYICTGRINSLSSTLLGARQELTPKFEQIAKEFVAGDFHPNTRCDIRWVTHKYFAWLVGQGFTNMAGVGAIHIQEVPIGLFGAISTQHHSQYTTVSEEAVCFPLYN